MSPLDRLLAGALWLLGVLFVAGITHITAIFAVPALEGKDAFGRLSALVQPGRLKLLPLPQPGAEIMPFGDPAVAQGVCLYDLAKGALRLEGKVEGDRLLTLSFRTPDGAVFYSMTDRAAQHGSINVLVLTPEQLEAVEADDDEDEDTPQELRLLAPTQKGIILVNALAGLPSEKPEAEDRVKEISCSVEPTPPD